MGKIYCYECDLSFDHMNAFLTHHRWNHNMTTKEYYDKHLKIENEGICQTPTCNNVCNFCNITIGYYKYCSRECSRKNPSIYKEGWKTKKRSGISNNRKKAKKTCIEKYGVKNVSEIEDVKNKKKETCLKNNGYEHWVGSKEHVDWMNNGGAAYCNRFVKNPSKPQIKLFQLCQEIFPYPILNYPCGRYSIDIVIPQLSLAIEYDGSWWHPDEEYDKTRQEQIENEGWIFLRYVDEVPDKNRIMKDMRKLL